MIIVDLSASFMQKTTGNWQRAGYQLMGLLHVDEICGFGGRGRMDLRLHPKLLSATAASKLNVLSKLSG